MIGNVRWVGVYQAVLNLETARDTLSFLLQILSLLMLFRQRLYIYASALMGIITVDFAARVLVLRLKIMERSAQNDQDRNTIQESRKKHEHVCTTIVITRDAAIACVLLYTLLYGVHTLT